MLSEVDAILDAWKTTGDAEQIIGVAGGFPGVQNGVHFTEHLMKALHALRGVIL
jgi:hypothetical protein